MYRIFLCINPRIKFAHKAFFTLPTNCPQTHNFLWGNMTFQNVKMQMYQGFYWTMIHKKKQKPFNSTPMGTRPIHEDVLIKKEESEMICSDSFFYAIKHKKAAPQKRCCGRILCSWRTLMGLAPNHADVMFLNQNDSMSNAVSYLLLS